jgi:hypothetical protein
MEASQITGSLVSGYKGGGCSKLLAARLAGRVVENPGRKTGEEAEE